MNSTPKSFSILSRLASRELCEAFCIFYCLVYSMGKAKTTFLRGFSLSFSLSGNFRNLPLQSANHCANIQKLNKNPGVAKFGIALEWGSRGRWFESSHSDQKTVGDSSPTVFCICNGDSNQRPFARSAIKSRRHEQPRPRRAARFESSHCVGRGLLHSASAVTVSAAKAASPQAPSSSQNRTRCAGLQFF